MDDSGGMGAPPPPPPDPGGSSRLPWAPKRPSEILGSSFTLFGQYWKDLIGITVIYVAIMVVLTSLIIWAVVSIAGNLTGARVASAIGGVILLLFALVMTGAITRLIASELAGQPVTVTDSLSYGVNHLGPILLIAVLVTAIGLAFNLVGLTVDDATNSTLLGTLLNLAWLVVSLLLSMAIPAFVVEGIHGIAALERSWRLVSPFFWHALGTFALAYLVVVGGAIVAGIFSLGGWFVALLAFFALFLFILPFFALVLVQLYVNLRIKSGGVTQASLQEELRRTA
jgi:hypothetical protein